MIADATFKQLRSLSAIIRFGTISAAAEHLHLTAPAVGQQLKLLERAVGMPLFERRPRGLTPTDAGLELLAVADRIDDELEGAARAIDLIRSGKIGSVTLGAVSTAKYFAPQLLAAFWHEHPDVDVRLVIGNRAETIAAIANHDVDIAIMGRPPAEMALDSSVLGAHPHVIIAPPTHPLASVASIAQGDLHDERFVVREVGSGTRGLTDALFVGAGIQPGIAMEATSNETIKQAVMAELGVALLSAHTVSAELADGRLVVLDVEHTPVIRHWSRVRRQPGIVGPAAEMLWAFLAARTQDHLDALL
jgi:DNA-binding transcriptional LysR family regulator